MGSVEGSAGIQSFPGMPGIRCRAQSRSVRPRARAKQAARRGRLSRPVEDFHHRGFHAARRPADQWPGRPGGRAVLAQHRNQRQGAHERLLEPDGPGHQAQARGRRSGCTPPRHSTSRSCSSTPLPTARHARSSSASIRTSIGLLERTVAEMDQNKRWDLQKETAKWMYDNVIAIPICYADMLWGASPKFEWQQSAGPGDRRLPP